MYKLAGFAALLISLLTATSCCEKRVYCEALPLDFAFTGFAPSDIRSFTVRRFAKGDQWGKALDSAQYIYYGTAPITTKPDTIPFADYRSATNAPGITQGNDWAIYLPAIGKTYYITTIFDDGNKSQLVRCNNDETTCSRSITNFSINNDWQSGSFLYIQKGRW